jgi:hypothetical protein
MIWRIISTDGQQLDKEKLIQENIELLETHMQSTSELKDMLVKMMAAGQDK